MTQWVVLLLALWSARHREEPTRLECWRRLVAADEPRINPIARGHR
jgi:hypothetical protein